MVDRRMLGPAVVMMAMLLAPSAVVAGKGGKAPACTVSAGVVVTTAKVKGVTTITVTGTTGTDTIDCSNATVRVIAHGVAGGGTGDTIYGGSANDDLYAENTGGGQTDYLIGNGGNDVLHTVGGGATVLAMGDAFDPSLAGGGNDTFIAGPGYVQFYGGDGADFMDLSASTGGYAEGDLGNDNILGSAGHDALYGGAGDDVITDNGGANEVFDCGAGTNDHLDDLDGNGTGDNGTGYLGLPEDDTHVGCESVFVKATP